MEIYWDDAGDMPMDEALCPLLKKAAETAVLRAASTFDVLDGRSPENVSRILSADIPSDDLVKRSADTEVSISFVTRAEIRRLNREYRGLDAETDVLSFNGLPPYSLGDIVICIAQAQAQAQAYGHSFKRELAFLVTHGMLHLLGYDHENAADEARMFAEQDAILDLLGITREENA